MADDRNEGPFYARRPTPDRIKRKFDLVRVRAGKSIRGIMLAGDLVGAYTHYWGGRTVPCFAGECVACKRNVEVRWHGYLPLLALKQQSIAIVEITDGCVEVFDDWYRKHRSLRGALVEVRRREGKANNPLWADLQDGPIPATNLPDPPDVQAILERMWGLHSLERVGDRAAGARTPRRVGEFLPGQRDLGFEPINGSGTLEHD